MKLNAALAKSLLMAASVGMVVPVLADVTVVKTTADTPPPARTTTTNSAASTTTTKATTAKSSGTAKPGTAAAAKKDAPPAELPGVVQPRAHGGFLTVEVEGGKFKISFYDKDKKPIPADVARGTARWDTHRKPHVDRTVLNPSDDGTLRGVAFVSPPYTFILFLTLLDADEKVVESYSIKMHP